MQRNIFRLLNIIFIETDPRRDSEIFSGFALILDTTNYLVAVIAPCGIKTKLCEKVSISEISEVSLKFMA